MTLPYHISRLRPYVLAGAGALVFDPTGKAGGFVPGAGRQAKAAFVYGGGADIAIVQRHLHTPGISFVLEIAGWSRSGRTSG